MGHLHEAFRRERQRTFEEQSEYILRKKEPDVVHPVLNTKIGDKVVFKMMYDLIVEAEVIQINKYSEIRLDYFYYGTEAMEWVTEDRIIENKGCCQ